MYKSSLCFEVPNIWPMDFQYLGKYYIRTRVQSIRYMYTSAEPFFHGKPYEFKTI